MGWLARTDRLRATMAEDTTFEIGLSHVERRLDKTHGHLALQRDSQALVGREEIVIRQCEETRVRTPDSITTH